MYTNCKGDVVDLKGDDEGDGDVVVDGDEDTSPHTKGVLVAMKVSISPRQRSWSSRIYPLPEKKRTFASIATSEKYVKNWA
jgi:hypothetical protein